MSEVDPPGAAPSHGAAPDSSTADEALLDDLEGASFGYFLHEANPVNGLITDRTGAGSPASIAAVGLALTAYPVGVERAWMTRAEAVARARTTLRLFADSTLGTAPDATGYRGFYYHFLDMRSGRRVWGCEVSTVDTALLLAGALAAAVYFDRDDEGESDVRRLADGLYRRVDWPWALDGGAALSHGWPPEHGFIPHRWEGYDEALLLYILGLGSPTGALPEESYAAWASPCAWRTAYGREYLYAGPLFTHQLSHVWIDFRGIQDRGMRERGLDFFENSRRATHVQRDYAAQNPAGWTRYGRLCWGLTASDGPGPATRRIGGVERRFFGYLARGVPNGPDDGTLAPWAVVASLPFAPRLVLPTVRQLHDLRLPLRNPYGFKATFNPTFPSRSGHPTGWVSPDHVGINQGPTVLMIENARSALPWRLIRGCPHVVRGLRRAGFRGGWL